MTNKEKSEIQKKIVDSLDLKPHGLLLLAPRIGKTRIIIDIIKKNNPKSILWVTPSAELATKDIPEEFTKWKAIRFKKNLTTVTWKSLNKIKGHYDLIVYDEVQFMTENSINNFISEEITYDYIIGMTGTQTKHENKKDLYRLLKLPILYQLSINEAVDKGLLADYQVKVIEIDLGRVKNIKAGNKDKPFFTTEEANYDYINKTTNNAIASGHPSLMFKILNRMRTIYNSPSKLEVAKYLIDNLSGRKLFFCSNINQAETLSSQTYHSKSNKKHLEQFISGEIDTITMVNTGGIGFTYKDIDHLIIVQCDSDSNGNNSQKIARTLLQQKNYKATIWLLCLVGTQDEKWIESALENFDKTKVEYIRYKNFKL
jgi:superfamily II DNA or RNA helicase